MYKLTEIIRGFVGLVLVLFLANVASTLNTLAGSKVIEYPIWAVGLGLIVGVFLNYLGLRQSLNGGFRTELFLKTGLILMGASINIGALLSFGAAGMVQAIVLITSVFGFTWWLSGLFKVEDKLRAVMAASVSICGVSAAIAAAGAVRANKEQLAYTTTLVILFALPLMMIMPFLAKLMGLSSEVAGAWIGGNIDTTAAVIGAGAIHSEMAMKVAAVVKMSQNTLIGLAAFLLALYWVLSVEKGAAKPQPGDVWRRMPKFILGFIGASIVASFGLLSDKQLADIKALQTVLLTMAFVSIGLEFGWRDIRRIGTGPLIVYAVATMFNTFLALAVASVLFGVL